MAAPRSMCRVCVRAHAAYTCPRCNTPYCGLECYKSHSTHCTESFYKDQAEQQLRSTKAGPEERSRMLEVLSRLHQEAREGGDAAEEALRLLLGSRGTTAAAASSSKRSGAAAAGEGNDGGSGDYLLAGLDELGEEGLDALIEELSSLMLTGKQVATGSSRSAGLQGVGDEGNQLSVEGNNDEEDEEEEEEKEEERARRVAAEAAVGRIGAVLSKDTLRRLLEAAMQGSLDDLDPTQLLSPSEAEAFERLATQGRLSHLLAPWEPWWQRQEARDLRIGAGGQRLLAPVVASSAASKATAADTTAVGIPEPPSRPLLPLSALSSARPSPLLRFQALQLLFSYCFVLRRFNGDPIATPMEAGEQLMALAQPLEPPQQAAKARQAATVAAAAAAVEQQQEDEVKSSSQQQQMPADAGTALRECLLAACAPPRGRPEWRPLALVAVTDVARLCSLGRPAIIVALTDLGRIVASSGSAAAEARDSTAASSAAHKAAAALRRRLKAAGQKLTYFLSWANEQMPEVWEALASATAAEHAQHANEAAEQRRRERPAVGAVVGVTAGPVGPSQQQESALEDTLRLTSLAATVGTPAQLGRPPPGGRLVREVRRVAVAAGHGSTDAGSILEEGKQQQQHMAGAAGGERPPDKEVGSTPATAAEPSQRHVGAIDLYSLD